MKEIYLIFKEVFEGKLDRFKLSQEFWSYWTTEGIVSLLSAVVISLVMLGVSTYTYLSWRALIDKSEDKLENFLLVLFTIILSLIPVVIAYEIARSDYHQAVLERQFLPKLNDEQIKILKKESFKLKQVKVNQGLSNMTMEEKLGFKGLGELDFNEVKKIMEQNAAEVVD